MSMKNSSDTIRNRNRDLLACSAVPQPTASTLASRIRMEVQFHPDPAGKLSANLYDIYHCCAYSEKLLMMDRGTVQNM
jgi:hypothetical protein